jgi:hypothetical protein
MGPWAPSRGSVDHTKYTQVAAKALSLAELFEARFAQGVNGPVPFRVELAAPDGPSTAGGKQALQHIKLIPVGGGPTIVIGSASTTRQTAEIRTFEHVAALYAQRFRGAPIPLDVRVYRDLTQALAGFFGAMRLRVSFSELDGAPAPSLAGPAAPAGFGVGSVLVGVAIGMVVMAAAFWVIFFFRR